jgi:hypothetical protein
MRGVTPGTLVQMRTLRRFHHYNAGELIAVPFDAAQDLAAKRLAQPLQLLVPSPVANAQAVDPNASGSRQPGSTVRK